MNTEKKYPVIGGAGLVLIVIGLAVMACAQSARTPGLLLLILGAIILIYALVTGNIKLFG